MRLQPRMAAWSLLAVAAACDGPDPAALDLPVAATESSSASVEANLQQTDRWVVVFDGDLPGDLEAQLTALGGSVEGTIDAIGAAFVTGLDGEGADALAARDDVTGIQKDFEASWLDSGEAGDATAWGSGGGGVGGTDPTTATAYDEWQWNMRQVRAHEAWPVTRQGEGVSVAILDTGVDVTHEELVGKVDVARSASLLSFSPCGPADTGSIDDLQGHGSFIGGLISSNGVKVASVAPQATLIAVKVLRCDNRGRFGDFIAGIVYAADVGADVINISIHSFTKRRNWRGALVDAFNRATNYANRKGTLVVTITGNFGFDMDRERDLIILPGESANTLTVGATAPILQEDFDLITDYSDVGHAIVDMVAPGGRSGTGDIRDGIRSVCASSSHPLCASGTLNYVGFRGTSFAAPMVAGAAAVVLGEAPQLTPSQVERCLLKGAQDLGERRRDAVYGWGRLDVMAAVDLCAGRRPGRGG